MLDATKLQINEAEIRCSLVEITPKGALRDHVWRRHLLEVILMCLILVLYDNVVPCARFIVLVVYLYQLSILAMSTPFCATKPAVPGTLTLLASFATNARYTLGGEGTDNRNDSSSGKSKTLTAWLGSTTSPLGSCVLSDMATTISW